MLSHVQDQVVFSLQAQPGACCSVSGSSGLGGGVKETLLPSAHIVWSRPSQRHLPGWSC